MTSSEVSESNSEHKQLRRFFIHAWCSLLFLLICRLIANLVIPLNDTTEARYSEIARKMMETENWVTLFHDYNVPFWAKPPLSTWLSALSMKWFGVNAFAARFPSLFLSIAVLGLVGHWAKKQGTALTGMMAVVILAGTFYFFLDAGAVMTEPALIFCSTLSLIGFWLALTEDSVLWSYLFFVGLGLGLLAKGPIAIVLVGLPLFFWVLWQKAWRVLWQKLPWIKGTLLMFLIALPWYLLAEHRTPGFLNYFILGEHVQRFLTPGWSGDKYGMAHHAPKGMIWPYALIGLMPWTVIIGVWLVKYRNKVSQFKDNQGWMSYLVLCTVLPLLFFTFAGNIIYTYVFPVVPMFALLVTELWKRVGYSVQQSMWIPYTAALVGVFSLVVVSIFLINPNNVGRTQKPVIQAWQHHHPNTQSDLLYWGSNSEFSAQFYSQGKAKYLANLQELCQALRRGNEFYLVSREDALATLPQQLVTQLKVEDVLQMRQHKIFLMHYIPLKQIDLSYCKVN